MRTAVVVIAAGQAGLAMSWWLSRRSIDHVVLERGDVANTWRTQRWDSLTLLTPNWQSRLPGYEYEGDDADAFRTMPQTIAFIEGYARYVSPPLKMHTTVRAVQGSGDGYEVLTDQGSWHSKAVVLASGAFNLPLVPKVSESVGSASTCARRACTAGVTSNGGWTPLG
jgi:putative flavoprotein involved in K+ transport